MSRSWVSFFFLIMATSFFLLWQAVGFHLLHYLSQAYSVLMQSIHPFVRDHSIRQIIVVITAPLLLALIPSVIYRIVTRRWLTEYMSIVWSIWWVLMTLIVIKQGI
jgi:hypothetical protein